MEEEQQLGRLQKAFVIHILIRNLFNSVQWTCNNTKGTLNELFKDYDEFSLHITIQETLRKAFNVKYLAPNASDEQLSFESRIYQVHPHSTHDLYRIFDICTKLNARYQNIVAEYPELYEIKLHCTEHKTYALRYFPALDACLDKDECVSDIEADTQQWLSALFNNHIAQQTKQYSRDAAIHRLLNYII